MKEYIVQAKAQETIDSFDAHNAPELIRCKDCKRQYNELKCPCGGYRPDDWFCADGEAKE